MNIIKGQKFKMNGTEYIVTGTLKPKLSGYDIDTVYFKNNDWDKPVSNYEMSYQTFTSKVKIENFI